MQEAEPVDVEKGIDLVSSVTLFEKMLKNFYSTLKQKVPELNLHMRNKNWEKLRFNAHQYKGASAYVAATRLHEACYALQLLSDEKITEINENLIYKFYVEVVTQSQKVEAFICKRFNEQFDEKLKQEYEVHKQIKPQNDQLDQIDIDQVLVQLKEVDKKRRDKEKSGPIATSSVTVEQVKRKYEEEKKKQEKTVPKITVNENPDPSNQPKHTEKPKSNSLFVENSPSMGNKGLDLNNPDYKTPAFQSRPFEINQEKKQTLSAEKFKPQFHSSSSFGDEDEDFEYFEMEEYDDLHTNNCNIL